MRSQTATPFTCTVIQEIKTWEVLEQNGSISLEGWRPTYFQNDSIGEGDYQRCEQGIVVYPFPSGPHPTPPRMELVSFF